MQRHPNVYRSFFVDFLFGFVWKTQLAARQFLLARKIVVSYRKSAGNLGELCCCAAICTTDTGLRVEQIRWSTHGLDLATPSGVSASSR